MKTILRFAFCRLAGCSMFCLLFNFGIGPAHAQNSGAVLWGVVVDTTSGAAVAGATVKVQLESDTTFVRYTYTNGIGKYRFSDLISGKYRVTYSMLGYTSISTEAQVGGSDPTMLRIVMVEQPLHSEDIVVTASRHEEKATHSPASISTISSMELREHVNATPTEALAQVAGIDVGHEGIAMSTYSSRSMHSVFGSDILTMNDYHSMEVPSIGGFYGILMPQINEDIDHIEVVRGPGSALYGPEAATGVVHIISKSPFSSQGTNVSLAGGERSYFDGGFRHAQAFGDNFAMKISGHYLKANDWQMADDPKEDTAFKNAQVSLLDKTIGSSTRDSLSRIGNRDYTVNVYSVEARAEAILSDFTTLNITGGLTNIGNQLAMSEDFGGAQIKDWMYDFVQARLNYKDLFVQGAWNHNDTKGSYFLPTGAPIVNRSSTYVAQIQHQYAPMTDERLTYGADYQAIHPISSGTIYGPDDGHADVNIFGVYLQSQTSLLDDRLEVVLAGRYDKHSYLKDPIISPRGAVVYHLNDWHLVRAMYNNTYLFPSENSMYADLLYAGDPFGTGMNIRYVSPYTSGLTFMHSGADPSLYGVTYDMTTPFAPGTKIPASAATGLLSANGGILWKGIMAKVAQDPRLAVLAPVLNSIAAPSPVQVGSTIGYLNLHPKEDKSNLYFPLTDGTPIDITAVKPQHASTMELDYQGAASKDFQFEVDAYQTHYDAIKASTVALTPSVLMNMQQLQSYLDTNIRQTLEATGMPHAAASATAAAAAAGIASYQGIGGLPLGVIQATGGAPTEMHPTDLLVGTRNYLENSVEFMGLDASFNAKASDIWSFTGSVSWLNKNYWYAGELNSKDSSIQTPFALNMPKYRASIGAKYSGLSRGLSLELRDRWSDAFKMDDSYWVGDVGARHVLDLTVNYHPDAEAWKNLNLTLSITNLLDNKHQELVGAPFIGRLTVLRAAYTLPSL